MKCGGKATIKCGEKNKDMTKNKHLIISFLWLLIHLTLHAQDFHFSGNNQVPMYLNPAMTGFIDGYQNRALIKHRNQWSSILDQDAFKTYAVSLETRICDHNFWGFGGFLMKDQSGTPSFATTQGLFSVSYHHNLGRQKYLAAGVNAGFINYQIEDNLTFPEQFDGDIGFDLGRPNFENLADFNANLLDMGLGILLYQNQGKQKWYLGMALQHINTSTAYVFKQSNTQNTIQLRMRKTIHGGLAIVSNKNSELFLKGSFQWQVPHWQSVMGLYTRINSVNIGVGARFTKNQPKEFQPPLIDAIILSFNYRFEGVALGFSYDLNVSPLKTATNFRGAFELTAVYAFGDNKECMYCPTF